MYGWEQPFIMMAECFWKIIKPSGAQPLPHLKSSSAVHLLSPCLVSGTTTPSPLVFLLLLNLTVLKSSWSCPFFFFCWNCYHSQSSRWVLDSTISVKFSIIKCTTHLESKKRRVADLTRSILKTSKQANHIDCCTLCPLTSVSELALPSQTNGARPKKNYV